MGIRWKKLDGTGELSCWYTATKEEGDRVYYIACVGSTESWGKLEMSHYGVVKRVDLNKITLPEIKDLHLDDGASDEVVLAAFAVHNKMSLHGACYGSGEGKVEKKVKALALKVMSEDKQDVPSKVLSLQHAHWDKLRDIDPSAYMIGFLLGMRKQDLKSDNEVQLAGWRHGWEYAVGRCSLPSWMLHSAKEEAG